MFYLEFLGLIKTKYKSIEIEKYKQLIESEKKLSKQKNDEKSLLLMWFCLSVIQAIEIFHEAFMLLKKREYYKAWDELGQIEMIINNINENIPDYQQYIAVSFLEQNTIKLQKIYPYKLFTSMAIIDTKGECSICGNSMNPFNGCEHIRGRVYAGKMCYSIISNGKLAGIDFVEKPAMKSAVVFDEIDNPEKYELLEYIIPKLPNEYTHWDYRVSTKFEPHNKFKVGRNEQCPCNSGKKYKHCCMQNPRGIKYTHYEFLLPDKLLVQDKDKN
jgi:hypothetical protein